MDSVEISGRRLELAQGDITTQEVDAIANAANSALAGGGGVDGAIHAAAGPEVMDELIRRYPSGTPTGTAAVTSAGRLRARSIVHAVGPRWAGGRHGEAELLASAYRESLVSAERLHARTIAFPAISCGIYGYPLEGAATIALQTVRTYLDAGSSIERVTFVLRSAEVEKAFSDALAAVERQPPSSGR
jgi:O-acetyl-ADP-ribose deacetylase (regulator of RNase III)